MNLRIVSTVLVACLAGIASAQDVPKWKLNKDRVIPHDLSVFGDSETYFVPHVIIHVTAAHRASADSEYVQKAFATGTVEVDGIDKAHLQGLAKKVHEDLVAKIRAEGYKVVTWDDLKADPALAKIPRGEFESRSGLPFVPCHRTGGLKYFAVTPTDEQYVWMNPKNDAVKALAREKGFVILSPDLRFTAPQIVGKVHKGSRSDSAEISVSPEMKLYDVFVNAITPKGKHGYIQVQEHTKLIVHPAAGTLRKGDEKKRQEDGTATLTAGYVFTADPTAYTAGLLSASYAVNDLIVETIDDEH